MTETDNQQQNDHSGPQQCGPLARLADGWALVPARLSDPSIYDEEESAAIERSHDFELLKLSLTPAAAAGVDTGVSEAIDAIAMAEGLAQTAVLRRDSGRLDEARESVTKGVGWARFADGLYARHGHDVQSPSWSELISLATDLGLNETGQAVVPAPEVDEVSPERESETSHAAPWEVDLAHAGEVKVAPEPTDEQSDGPDTLIPFLVEDLSPAEETGQSSDEPITEYVATTAPTPESDPAEDEPRDSTAAPQQHAPATEEPPDTAPGELHEGSGIDGPVDAV